MLVKQGGETGAKSMFYTHHYTILHHNQHGTANMDSRTVHVQAPLGQQHPDWTDSLAAAPVIMGVEQNGEGSQASRHEYKWFGTFM
jgi:hypothetical protein